MDRSKCIVFIIILCIVLIFVPPLCFSLREIIQVYKFNLGAVPENYLLSLFNVSTYKTFVSVVDPPFFRLGCYGILHY